LQRVGKVAVDLTEKVLSFGFSRRLPRPSLSKLLLPGYEQSNRNADNDPCDRRNVSRVKALRVPAKEDDDLMPGHPYHDHRKAGQSNGR
jgi:hypothetical protein